MNYEKTQKGNPNQLTINQHIFPVQSIVRFTDENNLVDLHLIEQNKQFKAKPSEKIFCARRSWDQRAESTFMKSIEDKYQVVATKIVNDVNMHLSNEYQAIITDMFALWNVRYHWNKQPIEDTKIEGAIGVAREYTVEEQEKLEKHGITAIRPDLIIPGRNLTGINIQNNIYIVRDQMGDAKWGILCSNNAEFIVPDNTPTLRIMPLTPKLCLFSQSDNSTIDDTEVAKLNSIMMKGCEKYYFSRDLSLCPTLK